ncbi:hypothetical protein [Streptomyces misionensis]|nr:hypothetical protein [Streptomyces misionensis]
MTTDLSALTAAADSWDGMAKKFHTQELAYHRHVCGITLNQNWIAVSADAARERFNVTFRQFQAAQTEAKAVASLLREAHTDFTGLRKKLESAQADAVKAGMVVSEEGVVSYDTAKLSENERAALHHDPDYQQSVGKSVASWQAEINRLVKEMGHIDAEVENALKRVMVDTDVRDGTLTGFNGQAHGDIKTYEDEAKREARTKADGWVSKGKSDASGPDKGWDASGPDLKNGKLGEVEAHGDLGSAEGEGSLTRGPWKLDGKADVYAGAKGSASAEASKDGITGDASVFAGGEGSAEGSVEVGPASVSGKTEATVGGEASASVGAGKDGAHVGAEAFAGAKGGGEIGADVGGISAGFSAEGWAGPGAEAEWGYKRSDQGVWSFEGSVGLSPALGGEMGFDFNIDPNKVAHTADDLAGAVGNGARSLGHAISNVF